MKFYSTRGPLDANVIASSLGLRDDRRDLRRLSAQEEHESAKSTPLAGRIAVVTGASSGIGRAIGIALAREGVCLCAVGRNHAALAETVSVARQFSQATPFQIDLTVDEALQQIVKHLNEVGRLDILIHCAGVMHPNPMEHARVEDLDSQYASNVRTPYLLTQRLLPLLTSSKGQVVFINSSAGLTARNADLGQYAATKHALKAVADSLREEMNPKGVRVISLYLGRTATPMQESRFLKEGRAYQPELLLQPDDVASVLVHALMLPDTAEVTDISMRSMQKSY